MKATFKKNYPRFSKKLVDAVFNEWLEATKELLIEGKKIGSTEGSAQIVYTNNFDVNLQHLNAVNGVRDIRRVKIGPLNKKFFIALDIGKENGMKRVRASWKFRKLMYRKIMSGKQYQFNDNEIQAY
jgi:hypothetical protein